MNIEKLQEKITKLEMDIYKLINEFETTTNTHIRDLELDEIGVFGNRLPVVVKVNIRVDI